MKNKTIVLTGTHLTPAMALTETLQDKGFKVVYLGRKKAMRESDQPAADKKLMDDLGVEVKTLSGPKFSRHRPFASILGLIGLPLSVVKAGYYLYKLKPQVVVSFGGYIALPVCLAAKLLGLPLLIHEQTLGAGLTNKLTAKLADKVAVSFPESLSYFPAKRTVVTGNPLRRLILAAKKSAGSPKEPVLYISGGNQGAKVINEIIGELLPKLLDHYLVYHQFGLSQTGKDWENQKRLAERLGSSRANRYHLKRWFASEELTRILKQRPLVVSRAGVNTITELAFLRLKAVVIPLPFAQKNEQARNARWLKKLNLAVVLPQSKLTTDSLWQALKTAAKLSDRGKKAALVPQAADKLARQVLQLIRD